MTTDRDRLEKLEQSFLTGNERAPKNSKVTPESRYNSGFYGHYRGQFRTESAREYRLAAKPQPPLVFLQRSKEPVKQHFFSKHDNRTSFDKGPYCLLQGIGKRKDLERLWQRHNFLHWTPCELELRQQRPLKSVYQTTFRSGPGLGDLSQRLVHFVQLQPPCGSTTYQQNYCHPSRVGHCGSTNMKPRSPVTKTLPDLPKIPRPKLLQHYLHSGVPECLNWSRVLNDG